MIDIKIFHIALLLWGGIFCIIATICMLLSKSFEKEKRYIYIRMEIVTAFLMISDSLAYFYRGDTTSLGYVMVRVSNFLVFILSNFLLLLYNMYICNRLFGVYKSKAALSLIRVRLGYILALAGVAFVIISQFTEMYYYFDENNCYHRNNLHPLSLIIPLVVMVMQISLIIQYRKNLEQEIYISLILAELFPIVGAILLIFVYGFSLINLGLCISSLLLFMMIIVEENKNYLMKKKENEELQIEVMLSQIAPHFIFNTFTTIQNLCVKDPKMAEETVEEFANYLRGNIDSIKNKETIPFEKELSHVKSYISIEKKRFGKKINVEYDLQENDFFIPAITVQPLVENAVKHGLIKKKGGGTIFIRSYKTDDNVVIEIEDNGVGFDTSSKYNDGVVHVGINNVRGRLSNMVNGSLLIDSEVGKGTKATILLPIEE